MNDATPIMIVIIIVTFIYFRIEWTRLTTWGISLSQCITICQPTATRVTSPCGTCSSLPQLSNASVSKGVNSKGLQGGRSLTLSTQLINWCSPLREKTSVSFDLLWLTFIISSRKLPRGLKSFLLIFLNYHLSGCHMKCHKDHVDREEACITMCNGK